MNAGPATTRAPQHLGDGAALRTGHTKITARALTKVIQAVTAEAFGSPAGSVTVGLHDVRGRLGISATVAVAVPSRHPGSPTGAIPRVESVYESASGARSEIIRRVGLLAGAEVGRVDIRVIGIHPARKARVR